MLKGGLELLARCDMQQSTNVLPVYTCLAYGPKILMCTAAAREQAVTCLPARTTARADDQLLPSSLPHLATHAV
jgi:hypothetical protein